MRRVFVDAVYRIAFLRPADSWAPASERAAKELAGAHLSTTDEVLGEFLAAMASSGEHLRGAAVEVVGALLRDPDVTVVAQSRRSFLEGLRL